MVYIHYTGDGEITSLVCSNWKFFSVLGISSGPSTGLVVFGMVKT